MGALSSYRTPLRWASFRFQGSWGGGWGHRTKGHDAQHLAVPLWAALPEDTIGSVCSLVPKLLHSPLEVRVARPKVGHRRLWVLVAEQHPDIPKRCSEVCQVLNDS